jgi:hypothetical protein
MTQPYETPKRAPACPHCGVGSAIVETVTNPVFVCKTGRLDPPPRGREFTISVPGYLTATCVACGASFSPAESVRRMQDARREAVKLLPVPDSGDGHAKL